MVLSTAMRLSQSKQLEDKIYFLDSLQCTKYACLDDNCHTVDLSPKYFPPCQSSHCPSVYVPAVTFTQMTDICPVKQHVFFLRTNHLWTVCSFTGVFLQFHRCSWESNCPSMCSCVEIENALNVKEGEEIPFE